MDVNFLSKSCKNDSSYMTQARNNARIMISGSLEMFSNRYVLPSGCSYNSNSIYGFSLLILISLCNSDCSSLVLRKLGAQIGEFICLFFFRCNP